MPSLSDRLKALERRIDVSEPPPRPDDREGFVTMLLADFNGAPGCWLQLAIEDANL